MKDPAPTPPTDPGLGTASPIGLLGRLVGRPVTIFMLFLTLIGTGVLAYLRIPLTLLPQGLSSSTLSVELPYPGAAPTEVEDQLTRPVEETLRTIPGIQEIFAVSNENWSSITVEFGNTVDMDVAYGEVRDRIERIRASLPPEMDRYRIRRWTQSDLPIVWIGVHPDPFLRRIEPVVRCEPAEIKKRRVVAGIIPVDQPDAGSVIDVVRTLGARPSARFRSKPS